MNRNKKPIETLRLNARDRRLKEALGEHSDFTSLHAAWSQVTSAVEKGSPFEDFVKHFLHLDPRYASRLKHVWLREEVPPAVAAKLRLPQNDQGIDLIAETKDCRYWAIQAKFRADTSRSLTWKGDLSTFVGLAFGTCRNIDFGLVCATSERLPNLLRKEQRLGFLARDAWFALESEYFDRLRAHLRHRPKRLSPRSPMPHQQAALTGLKKHFSSGEARGKLIMPCGTGKSLTAYWASRLLQARRVLVALPSLSLLNQTLTVWLRESLANREALDWLCVCSDETTGRISDEDSAFFRQDLAIECLTKPADIANALNRQRAHRSIVFTTYQSGRQLATAAKHAEIDFDLGVFDEAHRTAGQKTSLFAHLLHDSNIQIHRRLFMTATERRYRGQSDDVVSMNDTAIYGDTAHLLSFKRALEAKPPILCDYSILTLYVSKQEIRDLIKRNAYIRARAKAWGDHIEAHMLASLVAIRTAFRDKSITHAVSFHHRKARAKIFAELNDVFSKVVSGYPAIKTYHVTGDLPTATRAKTVDEFSKAHKALITNARCLTEGVDVPNIDAVLFADPRQSEVDPNCWTVRGPV